VIKPRIFRAPNRGDRFWAANDRWSTPAPIERIRRARPVFCYSALSPRCWRAEPGPLGVRGHMRSLGSVALCRHPQRPVFELPRLNGGFAADAKQVLCRPDPDLRERRRGQGAVASGKGVSWPSGGFCQTGLQLIPCASQDERRFALLPLATVAFAIRLTRGSTPPNCGPAPRRATHSLSSQPPPIPIPDQQRPHHTL